MKKENLIFNMTDGTSGDFGQTPKAAQTDFKITTLINGLRRLESGLFA